jgi:hypothetical protein
MKYDKYAPEVQEERQRRILLAVWAYAYEFLCTPLVTDARFDAVSKRVDPKIKTGHKVLDKFFQKEFNADTGMWIHNHPLREDIGRITEQIIQRRIKENLPIPIPDEELPDV